VKSVPATTAVHASMRMGWYFMRGAILEKKETRKAGDLKNWLQSAAGDLASRRLALLVGPDRDKI
jgi:hypothetical protein